MQQIIEFSTTNPILVTIFLILLFLFLRTFIATGSAKSINTMEAVRMMNNEDPLLLDVRTQQEFQQGHIASATNIPLGLVDTRISDIQNKKSSPVILICQSGNRSMQAARTLKKHGFENLFNLSGGMSGWQQANLPVASGSKSGSSKEKGDKKKSGKKKQSNISRSKPEEGSDTPQLTESQKEKLIVYYSGYCPFTSRVKKLLSGKGIDFQQVNLSDNPDMKNVIADRSGQTTFPQVFRGDTHIGNCDQLYQLEKDGKLNAILGLKHP